MIALILTIQMFLPGWIPSEPLERTAIISMKQVSVFDSTDECVDVLRVVSTADGVYEKVYPSKDGHFTTIAFKCEPTGERRVSK